MKAYLLNFILLILVVNLNAQSIKSYKLKNGMTVILDSNPNDAHVFGSIVVNVGSSDEEPNATGVAHYLEHMLFKGTTTLGTTDWEKEKVHYDAIIKLYDDLQNASTKEEIDLLNKKINDESKKQAQYIITNEFSAAIQQMGGKSLNATTNHYRTNFFNSFPTNQIEKWLSIYAHRFENPVFRLFQTELETVYEEKNRSADNLFTDYFYEVLEAVYGENSPYARPVIGKTEHLKKPWMNGMITFYNKWYVPNNMALILSGNFDQEKVMPMIEKYFGKMKRKDLGERSYSYLEVPQKKIIKKIKSTPYLVSTMNFIVPHTASTKEKIAMELIANILNNSSQTGLLDKLNTDGDVIFAASGFDESKTGNRLTIQYAPKFDINQFRQESFKFTEKLINEALNKIKKGAYENDFLENIKVGVTQDFEEGMSTPSARVSYYTYLFSLGKNVGYINNYMKLLKSIDKEYITEIAKKNLGKNLIVVRSERGDPGKKEKIDKPKLDPIKSIVSGHSSYFNSWLNIPKGNGKYSLFDPASINISPFKDKVNLHYMKNGQNNIFNLVVEFHAGNKKFPRLEYAISLLNNSGVLGQYDPDELRKEFGKLNVSYSFQSDENSTYITLQGYDYKLGEACQLLSRLMLLPEIKEKSLNGIAGRVLNGRGIEQKSIGTEQSALNNYLKYGKKSPYINRISNDSIISMGPSELSAVFNEAITYEADIHYFGNLSESNVKEVLNNNLAFGTGRKNKLPLETRKTKQYKENTILIVNEPKATQSHIYLFLDTENVDINDIPKIRAFNQYFSGGFNGLVLQEIREKRALAYTANINLGVPTLRKWNANITGYIGTQADKTVEVVEMLVDLLTNMPEYPDRIQGVKDYLKNGSEIGIENKKFLSLISENWKLQGYSSNPMKDQLPLIEKLSFNDVKDVFEKMVKNKKYAIGILGQSSKMDIDKLKKFGKVIKLKKSELFSD